MNGKKEKKCAANIRLQITVPTLQSRSQSLFEKMVLHDNKRRADYVFLRETITDRCPKNKTKAKNIFALI